MPPFKPIRRFGTVGAALTVWDVWRRLPPRFETAGKDWDSVLTELSGTMEIKLAADSYARPRLFDADEALPDVAGIPLRDALDRLCRQHGYFWWKQNGW